MNFFVVQKFFGKKRVICSESPETNFGLENLKSDGNFRQLILGLDYGLHLIYCSDCCLESKSSEIWGVVGGGGGGALNNVKQ